MQFLIVKAKPRSASRAVSVIAVLGCTMLTSIAPVRGQDELEIDFTIPPSNGLSLTEAREFENQVDLRTQRQAIQRLAAEGRVKKARHWAQTYCENVKEWAAGGDVHRQALVMAAQLEFMVGNFAEAEDLLRERQTLGTDYDRLAEFVDLRLAVVRHAQGQVAEAYRLANQWVERIKELPSFESVIHKNAASPRLGSDLRQLSDNLVLDGYYSEAALVQEAALKVYQGISPQVLVLADELAGTRMRQCSFRLALPAIKHSEALIRQAGIQRHGAFASVYHGEFLITREILFSEAHRAMGNLEPWYRRRLHSGTLLINPMKSPRYRVGKNVGISALAAGHIPIAADALYRYRRNGYDVRTDLMKTASAEFLVEHAIVFNNAALCASLCGDNDTAQSLLNESERAMTDNPHVSPIDLAIVESNRAWLCTTHCDYEASLRSARAAVKLATDYLGKRHPDTLILATQLARILETSGKYDEAGEHYHACLIAFDDLLGPRTTYSAYLLNRIGYLAYLNDDYPSAESRFVKALEIYDNAEFEHADGQLDCLRNLAALYRRTLEMDKLNTIEQRLPFMSRKTTIRSVSQR